jgi:dTDP-4-amino-4,6-dideoxygalactose transaminase
LNWEFGLYQADLSSDIGLHSPKMLEKLPTCQGEAAHWRNRGVFVERKRSMGKPYDELLKDLPSIQLPTAATQYAENIYWVYGVVLKDEIPVDAEEAMRQLAAQGVGSRPFFWPMHEQPVFRKMGLFLPNNYGWRSAWQDAASTCRAGLGRLMIRSARCARALRTVLGLPQTSNGFAVSSEASP